MTAMSPKRVPRGKPRQYTTCLLYNTDAAVKKLAGLTYATCNPIFDKKNELPSDDCKTATELAAPNVASPASQVSQEKQHLSVSDRMSCNFCDIVFSTRLDQKRHYRSDWHRYNLKQRLKGKDCATEEKFESIAGNVSSISGSDDGTESELDSTDKETKSRTKPTGIPSRLRATGYSSSTDSESEMEGAGEAAACRLPKLYFRNGDGELVSLYRYVIHHKKQEPVKSIDVLTTAADLPNQMTWAIFMAGGGHFAAAVFNKDKLLLHKTFHRYVVRAKRGTAQSQRDAQGNAPKSGGASLRRYNEAALTQEIQELIASWKDQVDLCDRIFLRAPSFNRRIFFSGKNPPLIKDDLRIRQIPFQTKRPTFNEVRRVHELLASIECYGEEAELQDFIPVSPPQVFNAETGQLRVLDEMELSPKHRKIWNKKIGNPPPASDTGESEDCTRGRKAAEFLADTEKHIDGNSGNMSKDKFKSLADQIKQEERLQTSSGTSTGSETELVETMETINLMELKEFATTKKPKRRKKAKKRKNSLKCQIEPDSSVFDEEKYHLKNNLYTASKTGDVDTLRNLLAIFTQPQVKFGVDQRSIQHDLEKKSDILSSGPCDSEETVANVNRDVGNVYVGNVDGKNMLTEGELSENMIGACMKVDDNSIIDQDSQSTCFGPSVNENVCCRDAEDNTKGMIDVGKTGHDDVYTSREAFCDVFSEMGDFVCPNSSLLQNSNANIANVIPVSENNLTDFVAAQTSVDVLTARETIVEHRNAEETDSANLTETNTNKNTKISLLSTSSNLALLNALNPHSNVVGKKLDIRQSDSGIMRNLPDLSPVVTVKLLNEVFGDNETSLLHVAAKEGHTGAVTLLMEAGANPAARDKGSLTPYMVAKDKPTRNEFRKFISKWPDRYDYSAAQIPSPLTEEQESERKLKVGRHKRA